MITDKLNMFSENQIDWYTAGTLVSTKSIDMGVGGTKGNKLPYYFIKTNAVAPSSGTGTSLNVQLISATNPELTSGVTVLAESGVIATAQLSAGRMLLSGKLPEKLGARYLGARYISVGTHNAGSLTGGLADVVPLE